MTVEKVRTTEGAVGLSCISPGKPLMWDSERAGDLLVTPCRRSEERVDGVCTVSSPLRRLSPLGGLTDHILLAIQHTKAMIVK